jgi:type VI secretion system secreted protein Hcp
MATYDMFLKIDGIEGESTDSKHSKEIELDSFHVGVKQTGTIGSATGGGGAGRVKAEDFHFTMKSSKASPKLFLACCTGEHITSATVTLRKAGKTAQEFMIYKFKNVVISSYQTGIGMKEDNAADKADDWSAQLEHISFNHGSLDMEYKEQKDDGTSGGSVKAGYNFQKNEKL